MLNELKSLTLNGKKYDSFIDQEARKNGGASAEGAVLYTEQSLTEEQKAQARANIGAGSVVTVNGNAPDENGNVTIEAGGGGGGGSGGDKVRSDNLIDMSTPDVLGSDWTYDAATNTYYVSSDQCNSVIFNLTNPELGKLSVSFKVKNFNSTGASLSATLRDSAKKILASVYPKTDGLHSFSYNISEPGEYTVRLSSSDKGVSTEVYEIMVNYGETKPYQPYYIENNENNPTTSEIADYNLTALNGYIEELKSFAADVKIPVMTDIHTEKLEPYAMFNHLAKSSCADMCIALGDYIPTHYATKAECFNLFDSVVGIANRQPTKSPVFMLRGNHDTNIVGNADSTSYVSDAEFYDRMETRTKNINGVSRKNYGYVDLESARVRVVMLDAADVYDSVTGERLSTNNEVMIQQEQFAWLANVALDFTEKKTPTDWSVIVFSHSNLMTLSNSGFRKLIDAFTNGKDVTINDSCSIGGYTALLSVTTNYSTQGALTFICTVSGHQHADMVKDIASASYPNIVAKEVFVPAENSGAYYKDENGEIVWYTRTKGTIEEHCFDTVCIDKTNRKVIFKRLGIGSDREINY